MFLTPLLTAFVTALRGTFDEDYPVEEFRSINIGVDYPIREQDYPGVWVDFSPTGPTRIAGVSHKEYADTETSVRELTRWTYQGTVTFTPFAFSSLERYRLADELIRVIAFGKEQAATAQFRSAIEANEFLAINMDFDTIDLRGFSTSQGTPWGGTEFIYEATLSSNIIGEYVTDVATGALVTLSDVELHPYNDLETDPFSGDMNGWV